MKTKLESIIYTPLEVGLEKPVRILQITDVHLSFADERDSEYNQNLAVARVETFSKEGGRPPYTPSEYFEEAVRVAEETGSLLVLTGDVIDIQTQANLDEFHRIIDGHDCMFTPGGHEQQKRCVRTMEEPDNYWEGARQRLKDSFPQFDMDLSSRVINGLNIVCLDNSLDHYNAETLRRFKLELEKGLPMILFSHDPITCGALTCWEDPKIPYFTEEDYKIRHEMIDLIKASPLVKGYFVGHWHSQSASDVEGASFRSYVTPGLFKGLCRMIEIF